jgi:hypothetical protein
MLTTLSSKSEAERFEQAIVDVSRTKGRQGIICLPGAANVIKVTGTSQKQSRSSQLTPLT